LLLFLGITECGSEGVAGGQQCEGSTHADCPENASSVKVEATDSQLHAKTTHADDLPIMRLRAHDEVSGSGYEL